MAQPIEPKSDADRRYHSSCNTGRQSKSGVRSQQPAENVVLGCSEECITEWFGTVIESLRDSNQCKRRSKKACLGFRDTNIAVFIDSELGNLVVDQYPGQAAVEL